jgi:hypothetical protein
MSAPKIPDGPEGDRVRACFAEAGLEPSNPDDWPKLILILRDKLGAPQKHDEQWRQQLLDDALEVHVEHLHKNPELPPLSEREVCKRLTTWEKYQGYDWDALRKLMSKEGKIIFGKFPTGI